MKSTSLGLILLCISALACPCTPSRLTPSCLSAQPPVYAEAGSRPSLCGRIARLRGGSGGFGVVPAVSEMTLSQSATNVASSFDDASSIALSSAPASSRASPAPNSIARSDSQAPMQLLHSMAEKDENTGPQKYVILISDKTGFTASHVLTAALFQFAHISNRTNTQVFSNIKTWQHIDRIISLAARINALVCFTFTDPELRVKTIEQCGASQVQWVDVLGSMLDTISGYIEMQPSPSTIGGSNKKKPLSNSYFTRIEAVDFAIRQDDGNMAQNLLNADIVLLGISRVQKTPLSMYLAQQFGLKAANARIVLGQPCPPEVYAIEPRRVFVLTAQADYIYKVRRRRLEMVAQEEEQFKAKGEKPPPSPIAKQVAPGFTLDDYANIDYIRKEIEFTEQLLSEHSEWNRLEMTGVSVEEMADHYILPKLPRKPTMTEAALEALSCNFCLVKVDNNDIERYEDELVVGSRHELKRGEGAAAGDEGPKALDLGAGASWAKDMKLIFASEGCTALTGVEKEKLVSGNVVEMFQTMCGPNTDIETMREVMGAFLAGKERTYEVVCYRGSDPENLEEYVCEIHVAPVKNAAGQVVLYVVALRQKQGITSPLPEQVEVCVDAETGISGVKVPEVTAEQIRYIDKTRRQTFYTIFDASNERLPLLFASKGFFKMTGYTEEDVSTTKASYSAADDEGAVPGFSVWGDFFAGAGEGGDSGNMAVKLQSYKLDESDIEQVIEVKRDMREMKTITTCVKSFRKDGKSFWNFCHLEPVHDDSGEIKYYVGSHHGVLDGSWHRK